MIDVMIRIVLCIAAGAAVALLGCQQDIIGPSPHAPRELFEALLRKPIPPSVKDLQGTGATWQGYEVYLRFRASAQDTNALVSQGFKPTSWDSISFRFINTPKELRGSISNWNPEAIPAKECYQMENVRNGWTHQGEHLLVIDRSTGTVFFYGIGA
jgi:hypothetical protein